MLLLVARLRGGVEVVASDNVKLESSSDGRVHALIISKVSSDDEGEYTVRATTDCAQISSAASIVIQRMQSYLYTVSRKNDTDVTHYRFNPHQPISVIFDRDVAERVCY